jgi:two-component system, LytTR family, sensor kinase
MKKDFFAGKKIKLFLHLLAWFILLGLPVYFIKRWNIGSDFIWLYYINTVVSGIIFYANYFFLVPYFFFRGRKIRYFLSILVLLLLFYLVSDTSNGMVFKYVSRGETTIVNPRPPEARYKHLPPGDSEIIARPPYREMHVFNYASTSLLLIFFSLGLRILERHSEIEKVQKEIEKERLNSELAFLKNQISPHFFFNTLNNIYSLIEISREDSQKAVLKLSKLMRYLLYESESGDTKLSNEIDFMNNYIDLMKLRITDKVDLKVSFPENYEDMNIPPLLFVPFIENAFKHGISNREKSFIDINMLVAKGSVTFKCSNSLFTTRENQDLSHSGIGLENAEKRLGLLFPGKHDLRITSTGSSFEVLLFINII